MVGPGLGRDKDSLRMVETMISKLVSGKNKIKIKTKTLILDADYLWWLA